MFADSSGGRFRLDLRGFFGIAASILTVLTILYYFHLHRTQPNPGFVFHPQEGELLHVSDGRAVDKNSGELLVDGERLQVGDQILRIGDNLFQDYVSDWTLPIFAVFRGDRPVEVEFKRGDDEPRIIYLRRYLESPSTLYSVLVFLIPILFWAMGTLTVVFLYPRDDRWLLMVLFQYDTALWISTGFVSYSHEGYSLLLYFIFISLFCPLSIHLHLILPDAPARKHHRWILPALYLLALAMIVSLVNGMISRSVLYGSVLFAALISMALVVLRVFLPSAPAVQIARRTMLYGLGAGLAPMTALIIAYSLNPVGLLASIFDDIILGVFLLTLPAWLCAYIFAIYKNDLGFFEFRANRLLGIYGFFSIFVALYMLIFELSMAWLRPVGFLGSENFSVEILGLTLSLVFVAVGQPLYVKFQKLVDFYVFNIKYSASEIVGAFAEKIPRASNRKNLKEVVVGEILPALSIRQSGLYLLREDEVELIYQEDVPEIDHAPSWSKLQAIADRPGRFLRDGPESVEGFSWVRATLLLSTPEKAIGVWLLGRRDPDDHYSKDDIMLLTKLANQIGPVVENFKLVEQARREVEENRKLQEQLIHSQKMEAIGRLSAGVAHDFNNILSVIIGYSNLVMAQYQGDSGLQKSMKSIKDAGERAATLTRQLLAFSRQQVMEAQVTSVNLIVSDVEKMLRRLAGEDIELRTELSPEVPNVKIDPGQMGQVIINLVVNARDAMPEGGSISISTGGAQCRVGDAQFDRGMMPGSYAMIRVEDSGTGIEPDLLAHIFEPYFTTKEKGKGTGLGLSMVYGIISQCKGHVFVDSELGKGTTFEIFFPATVRETLEDSSVSGTKERRTFGTETVLLVEDEESVRAVTTEILQVNGYTVIQAEDGPQAVDKFKQNHNVIDLLLTDVVMPHMRGTELARRLLELEPRLKIVYMSGYSEESIVNGRPGDPMSILIHKPFSPQKLARSIRDVLDDRQGGERSVLSMSG